MKQSDLNTEKKQEIKKKKKSSFINPNYSTSESVDYKGLLNSVMPNHVFARRSVIFYTKLACDNVPSHIWEAEVHLELLIDVYSRAIAGLSVTEGGVEGRSLALLSVAEGMETLCRQLRMPYRRRNWVAMALPLTIVMDPTVDHTDHALATLGILTVSYPPHRPVGRLERIVAQFLACDHFLCRPFPPFAPHLVGQFTLGDWGRAAVMAAIEYNNRVRPDIGLAGITPAVVANWGIAHLTGKSRQYDIDKVRQALLPRVDRAYFQGPDLLVSVGPLHGLKYSTQDPKANRTLMAAAKSRPLVVHYDPRDASVVWVVDDKHGKLIPYHRDLGYAVDTSWSEALHLHEVQRENFFDTQPLPTALNGDNGQECKPTHLPKPGKGGVKSTLPVDSNAANKRKPTSL
jgi:hypothetical protein